MHVLFIQLICLFCLQDDEDVGEFSKQFEVTSITVRISKKDDYLLSLCLNYTKK